MSETKVKVKSKKFIYETKLKWKGNREGLLTSEGRLPIEISTPPEFKGRSELWTPENLLIASVDSEGTDKAMEMIKDIIREAEIGKFYLGKVVKIMDFGAFVEVLPGSEGLVHISQLANERVNKVTDILKEGDEVLVKVIDIENGKVRLSRKAALGHSIDDI